MQRRAAVDTGLVQAGNGIVQVFQYALLQVQGSVIIHNIQFHAHHQPDAVKGPSQDFEIDEMEGMAAAGHGRGMIGASEQGQSFGRSRVNHLVKGVIGMAAGRCMCVQVQ